MLTAGAAALSTGLLGCSLRRRPLLDTVGAVPFDKPLHIPPLAASTLNRGARVFDLELRSGQTALVAGGTADTWGINGTFLGPTVRVARGETIRMNVHNALPEVTSLHWHGMHLPPSADGGPRQPIEPGTSWSPEWKVEQEAATLWYHPHPHGRTEQHVYRGLAGLLLVDDDYAAALPLPARYGVDDIPLIVQDKTFADDGSLIEGERTDAGLLGTTVLVNGTVGPVLTLTAERTRLRILNGSTARSYAFGFDDDRAFVVIAGDGGLLDAPLELRRVLVSPGERVEIVVTAAPSDLVALRSFPHDLGVSDRAAVDAGARDELDVLLLRASPVLEPSPQLPSHLAAEREEADSQPTAHRSFTLRNDRINGLTMDATRVDFDVAVNTSEIWEIENTDNAPHNFHVHGVQFQVLDIAGRPPAPELAGPKDTVYTPPDQPVRIAVRFTDHADPQVPLMYHCHLLQHEDRGMMGQFVVLAPGQQRVPLPPVVGGDHDH
ncbi:multicopper oxidase family protein [Nesterenkonia ebinurensis]|uniref:multicopper oxidase family protein n=1 Tax=Nesterenkonia ebinurensis TaxID=2608252 RepID=UPI00123DF43E|nr:multicopper oxidase domain-containing protein [Nesterenkonia ebinurensis]